MKIKFFIYLLIFLIVGFMFGFVVAKTSVQTKINEIKPSSSRTQTFISKISEDIDNDNKKEEIELAYTECYKKGLKGEDMPVGCPGKICVAIEESCDKPYFEITAGGMRSGKTHTGSYAGDPIVAQIETASFGKEKFFVVSPLTVGAHSSQMRIFKVSQGNIVPVCRNKIVFRGGDSDKCAFYSDVGGPFLLDLDNNGFPEVIEESYNYDSVPREIILGEVSIYDGNQFITQEGENYQKFLELLKENNTKGLEIVSREHAK